MLSDNKCELLVTALSKNPESIEGLCKEVNLKPRTLWEYIKFYDLKLPENIKSYRMNSEIDNLIDLGWSAPRIGRKIGITREGIRIYLNYTGQYKSWYKKRQEIKDKLDIKKKEEREDQANFLRYLKHLAYQIIKDPGPIGEKAREGKDPWALEKALDYKFSTRKRGNLSIPISSIVDLFENYIKLIRNGEKKSLYELGKTAGIKLMSTSKIFSKVGVTPMYGNRKRSKKKHIILDLQQKS